MSRRGTSAGPYLLLPAVIAVCVLVRGRTRGTRLARRAGMPESGAVETRAEQDR